MSSSTSSSTSSLAGITVLDLSSVGPASRCSRLLADYGAEVVKVGPPPRKGGVQIQPPFFSYGAGRGFKKLRVDLKAPEGLAAFLKLAGKADVLIESFRPGVAKRIGVGYEAIRAMNPGIVYCSTSGFGQTGPRSQWAGHDINYLAVGGFLDCSGKRADGGPPIPGATIADSAGGGMHATIAILTALLKRGRSGEGSYLDVSVAEGVLNLMSLSIDQHLATGDKPGPGHDILTGRFACYELYEAKDGKWVSVGAIEPQFYANLCKALDCEKWLEHQQDDAVQDEIRSDFRAAFKTRSRDEWVADLGPNNTCIAPVNSIEEVVTDEQFRARKAFVAAEHDERGRFELVGPVLAGCTREEKTYQVRDAAVTDTVDLLRGAGISAEEIEKMQSDGILA